MTIVAAVVGVAVPVATLGAELFGEPSRPVLAGALALAAATGAVTYLVARRADGHAAELERGRNEFRRALVRLGDALTASDDREALVGVVLDAALALAGADEAVFWIDRGRSVEPVATSGTAVGAVAAVPVGEGLVGGVATSGEPVRWPAGSPAPAPGEPRGATSMAVPIPAGGRLYGVLSLHRRLGPTFSSGELDDIVGLARQAGAAIDTTFLHEEARRLSLTDGLTGLWNRRQFELRVAQELERAARFGERFAVIVVDLDDFKAVNDTYGHLAGDAVLVETARRLVAQTREVDLVARLGGEEFVLLLPQTDAAGAGRVAEKVRAELAAEPVQTDVGAIPVTLSAGLACHPEQGATIETLFAAADAALYRAKAAGKNRIQHAHG